MQNMEPDYTRCNPDWIPEPPTTPGMYWFYGERFETDSCDLRLVEVWKTPKRPVYVTSGNFMYPQQFKGLWQKALLPDLPHPHDPRLPT